MKYTPEKVDEICQYLREGDTQKAAHTKAGVGESTFYEWLQKVEFAEKVKKAQDEFRATIVAKLEESLWKKATGYEATETEIEYVSAKDGTPIIKSQKTKKKHIPPDTGALTFALCNVAPEKWTNTQRHQLQATEGVRLAIEVADTSTKSELEKLTTREKDADE